MEAAVTDTIMTVAMEATYLAEIAAGALFYYCFCAAAAIILRITTIAVAGTPVAANVPTCLPVSTR